MPLVPVSSYPKHALYFGNGHLETLVAPLFAHVRNVPYERERLELLDGDFIDLDWLRNGHDRLIILSSGMEGNATRHYMKRAADFFSKRGWDVLAWNYRGCSEEINRLPKTYSYAETHDFRTVINYALKDNCYSTAALLGFSMGGCLVTKYLGERPGPDPRIKASVSFSVSCNLKDSMQKTERNPIYNLYFIKKLKQKLQAKALIHSSIRSIPLNKIRSFDDYLSYYNIPFHHFRDVDDFYVQSSCAQYISSIEIPSLMINPLNDPILGPQCYPYELAKANSNFYLETPATGGHLGYPHSSPNFNWMAERANEFINGILKTEKV